MSNQDRYVAEPSSPNGTGVLVLHAWWGLNDVVKSLCDRLAAEGFVALAPDLYKGKVTASIPEAEKLLEEQDVPYIDATIQSAIDALQNHPLVRSKNLGVIGFSLGGFHAFRLADQVAGDAAALVIFYATWSDPFETFRGAVQGHFAEDDPFEPEEARRAVEATLKESGIAAELHDYPGTGHWFFEPDRPDAYHAQAADLAWRRTLDFLKRSL